MNIRKSFLIALVALLVAGPPLYATTVGLSSDSVNLIYAEQKKSEWCWAACIQMIANLYGADLTQDEVVARSYGPNVNHAGSLEVITANLNGNGTTGSGRTYTIDSQMLNNRSLPAALVEELAAGHPVMLGCNAGNTGHAMVCTAVSYDGSATNPVITSLTVRDPWPCAENRSSNGRHVMSGADLGPRIMEGWVIHLVVHDTDGQTMPAPQGYTFNDSTKTPNPTTNTASTSPAKYTPSFTPAPERSTASNTTPSTPRTPRDTSRNTTPSFTPSPDRSTALNPSANTHPSTKSQDEDEDEIPASARRMLADAQSVVTDMMALLSTR